MSTNHKIDPSVELEFELRFLKSHGVAFQELFSEVMENSYPGDFVRVRPHGPLGDMKCDGYLPSQKTIFQVYGPDDLRVLQKVLKKIQDDFTGALHYWNDRMVRWVFVHNCRAGLPAQVIHLLEDLGSLPNGPEVKQWGYPELLQLVLKHAQETPSTSQVLAEQTVQFPFRTPNEIRNFFLPYWIWLKNAPEPAKSGRRDRSQRALGFPIKLISPTEVHRIITQEELEIAERKTKPEVVEPFARRVFPKHREVSLNLGDLLQSNRRVLIVGDFGTGKTTILKRFSQNEAKRLYKDTNSKARRRTPVFVELWRFREHRSLMDLIVSAIAASGVRVSHEQLGILLSEGYLTLLLDGLDEVAIDHRRECLAQILDLVETYSQTNSVITSRPFPSPPDGFHEVAISPLTDSDIASALTMQFASIKAFKQRFNDCSPSDYVDRMRPEIRQLCRRPLTLTLVLTLLEEYGELPSTLNGVYDRFFAHLLDWETKTGRLISIALAASLLEETAYLMATQGLRGLPVADLVRDAGRNVEGLGNNAENIFGVMASTGLLRLWCGEVSFSHQTFLEFLAARKIVRLTTNPENVPLASHFGIARFLCGRVSDVSPLLEKIIEQSDTVETLVPLLEEASRNGSSGGRFEVLFRAIGFAENLAIELSYSGPDYETEIGKGIEEVIETSLTFKPKALFMLKNAADGIARSSASWTSASNWFAEILGGLRVYGWAGCELHERFARIFFDDEYYMLEGDEDGSKYDELIVYLDAMYSDDFSRASKQIEKLEHLHRHWKADKRINSITKRALNESLCSSEGLTPDVEDPIAFLRQNPFGWLYGDDEVGEYEFTWLSSEQVLFDNALELVRSFELCEMDDLPLSTCETKTESSLKLVRRSFEESGLSNETLSILFSNTDERSGIGWWGTFEDLKTSNDFWPSQVRNAFRNHTNPQPIQPREEFRFADFVTRYPFNWEFSRWPHKPKTTRDEGPT